MTRAGSEPGDRAVHPGDAHVLAEIASQPDCWTQALQASGEAAKVLPDRGERVAITGCGTSWHVATAIALAREAAGHGETDAFPASELPVRAYDSVLAISRSGTTTEVLDALKNVPGPVRKIGITADAATPIRDVTDQLLVLDYADEQSVVQTRFATTVLTVARAHLGHDLAPVVEQAREAVAAELDDRLVDRPHYVFLGGGWAAGVAREAALKVEETGAAWSEAYPALEYRHGPLAAATGESVVWVLGQADDTLVRDIGRTGASVIATGRDPQAELVLVQRVAVATAQARGLDPDRPRYLARSVLLTGQ
jgi:fructoselysine-6-P-deglycase FrlB-like protein